MILAGEKAMTSTNNGSGLKWKTLAKKRRSATQGIPPGTEALQWVANTVTLIYGNRDAVLVDTFLSADQTRELADWIAASGKNLTAIYVTHAHGDHFFGIGMLEERFPGARAVATAEVIEGMRHQISPEYMAAFWNPRFPGQLPARLSVAAEIRDGGIDLEGHALVPVRLGHTDTADSTCLHVPSVGLIVAGDAVYNGIHPYLAETNARSRRDWIAALDTIEGLQPTTVIAGHKVPNGDDSPRHVAATRTYIRDFDQLDANTQTADELYERMLRLYPDRVNPGSLWGAAHAAKSRVSV
jgi:glyoxylase-like metal-dependent hydrolase (beta-lactamase superfamily II)